MVGGCFTASGPEWLTIIDGTIDFVNLHEFACSHPKLDRSNLRMVGFADERTKVISDIITFIYIYSICYNVI